MYNPINNQRFWILRFRWTCWCHKRFRGTCWRHKRLIITGWHPKQSKQRYKQRSKGIHLHYQRKTPTKIIEELVHPKDHPRQNPYNFTALHGGCAGNPRDFGRAPDGAPEGYCHRRGAQWRTHFRTPREIIRTGRDGSMPRDVNTAVSTARLNNPRPSFNSTFNSPTRNGNQDIVIPRQSIIATEARNKKPLNAPINRISAVHGYSTSIFSKVIGPKTVSGESADVYAHERMEFTSNSLVDKSPNFLDLGLSPANTTDNIKSIVGPRVDG